MRWHLRWFAIQIYKVAKEKFHELIFFIYSLVSSIYGTPWGFSSDRDRRILTGCARNSLPILMATISSGYEVGNIWFFNLCITFILLWGHEQCVWRSFISPHARGTNWNEASCYHTFHLLITRQIDLGNVRDIARWPFKRLGLHFAIPWQWVLFQQNQITLLKTLVVGVPDCLLYCLKFIINDLLFLQPRQRYKFLCYDLCFNC